MKLTGKKVSIIALFFVAFTSVVLPYISNLTTTLIGVSESPDTLFTFQLNDYYIIRESYGSYGRQIYILMRYTFDIVWPIVYTLFLVSAIYYLQVRVTPKLRIKLYYLPLFAVLFDLLENISATIFMVTYPKEVDFVVYILMGSSVVKWIAITISFVVLFAVLIKFIFLQIKGR